jgi:hypothetical protein
VHLNIPITYQNANSNLYPDDINGTKCIYFITSYIVVNVFNCRFENSVEKFTKTSFDIHFNVDKVLSSWYSMVNAHSVINDVKNPGRCQYFAIHTDNMCVKHWSNTGFHAIASKLKIIGNRILSTITFHNLKKQWLWFQTRTKFILPTVGPNLWYAK